MCPTRGGRDDVPPLPHSRIAARSDLRGVPRGQDALDPEDVYAKRQPPGNTATTVTADADTAPAPMSRSRRMKRAEESG